MNKGRKKNNQIQVNLSELSLPNPRRSTRSIQIRTSSKASQSTTSSRFVAALKQSLVSGAKSITRVVLTREDDGCTTAGLALLLAWLDVNYSFFTGRKHFEKEFIPNWPGFKKPEALAACWIQAFLLGTWIFVGTFVGGQILMRLYYVLVPWLLLIPLGFCLFYVFYTGQFTLSHVEAVLLDRMSDIASQKDLKIWDDMQNHFECCGVKSRGWEEWDATGLRDVLSSDMIIPLSCCRDKSGYDGCQKHPNERNTHKQVCGVILSNSYLSLGSFVVSVHVAYLIISVYSVFSASRYYSFLTREQDKKVRPRSCRCCLECLVPCLICCCTGESVDPENSQLKSFPSSTRLPQSSEQTEAQAKEKELSVLHEGGIGESSEEELVPLSMTALHTKH